MYRLPDTDDALLGECDVEVFRGSGPGGQHRNRTESGVRLRHRPTGALAGATERRSQHQNFSVALGRLRERIERLLAPPPPPRRATAPTRGSVERRHAHKRNRARVKSARGRVGDDD